MKLAFLLGLLSVTMVMGKMAKFAEMAKMTEMAEDSRDQGTAAERMNEEDAMEKRAKLELVKFEGGRPGATSTTQPWNQDWSPGRAFQRQSPDVEADSRHVDSRPWLSGKLPATVYYNFPYPITVAKFSFRNRREKAHSANNPIDFNFVGSDDCKSWTVISGIIRVDWGMKQDEEKIWTINQIDRKKFKCFGIQVLSITGKYYAAIQDLKMWKEFSEQRQYFLINKMVDCEEAAKLCQSQGAQLATVKSFHGPESQERGLFTKYLESQYDSLSGRFRDGLLINNKPWFFVWIGGSSDGSSSGGSSSDRMPNSMLIAEKYEASGRIGNWYECKSEFLYPV